MCRLWLSVFKRTLDLGVCLLVTPIVALLGCVVAFVVFFHLGRPIFFLQERSGLDGRPFTLIKFRSMRDGIDVADSDDARLGPVGRWLRRSSLDEIPSLINVFKGEMSLVGPRPLPTRYFLRYRDRDLIRFRVRPGITGLAQVMGRNGISWEAKFAFDRFYVRHHSFALDFWILFSTVRVVLGGQGVNAEGVAPMPEFFGVGCKRTD